MTRIIFQISITINCLNTYMEFIMKSILILFLNTQKCGFKSHYINQSLKLLFSFRKLWNKLYTEDALLKG